MIEPSLPDNDPRHYLEWAPIVNQSLTIEGLNLLSIERNSSWALSKESWHLKFQHSQMFIQKSYPIHNKQYQNIKYYLQTSATTTKLNHESPLLCLYKLNISFGCFPEWNFRKIVLVIELKKTIKHSYKHNEIELFVTSFVLYKLNLTSSVF